MSLDPSLDWQKVADFLGMGGSASVKTGVVTVTVHTEQGYKDARADLTTINGQTFTQWLAEHTPGSRLTLRREAKEALMAKTPDGIGRRAILKAMGITRAQVEARIDAGDGD